MKLIKLILLLFVCCFSFSQTKEYEKGKIIDSILVKETTDESFVLYLPTSFNKDINATIIFVFDPSGNGKRGVEVFQKAAEKFNYLLVCSNNSRNGPYQRNLDITNRLFSHVFSEFNIDSKQIYTAGFSGGSRLACTVAVLTGAIQGVIGCGASFAFDVDKKPAFNSKFSYVGLVGDEDMNYQEMFHAREWLSKVSVDNELFTYEDGHKWPPEIQINRAFSWLELQAYKRKIRPINKERLTSMYLQDYEFASSIENDDSPLSAVYEYERLDRNYKSYFDMDSISAKIFKLKSSNSFQTEFQIRSQIEAKEYRISESFLDRFRKESTLGRSDDNYTWWKNELKDLNNEIKNDSNYFTVKMVKRLRYRLFAVAIESSNVYSDNNDLERALYCNKLLVILNKEQPYLYFRLAQNQAKLNMYRQTLSNLEKAIELGFKNIDAITNEKEFEKFKTKKKFHAFLESLNN